MRNENRAVLTTGRPVRHLPHLVLSLCCWLWFPVWVFQWIVGGERTLVVAVDERGEVQTHLQRMSLPRMAVSAVLVVAWAVVVAALIAVLVWLRRVG